MTKERDPISEINKVCKAALKLQESDFVAMEEVITQQSEYNSPLKMATNIRQSKLAEHNRRVIDKLKELREVILSGTRRGDEKATLPPVPEESAMPGWKL